MTTITIYPDYYWNIFSHSQEYFSSEIYFHLKKYRYSQDYEGKEDQHPKPKKHKLIMKKVKPLSNELQ